MSALTLHELGAAATRGGLNAQRVGEALRILAPNTKSLSEPITPEIHQGPAPIHTLRDYFMAHAPADPQTWFQPVMPACPDDKWVGVPDGNTHRLAGRDPRQVPEERLMRFLSRVAAERACQHEDYFWNANEDAQEQWRADQKRERYLQWPGAWADEMIKRRGGAR